MKPLENVREVLGALRHRSRQKIYCPRCGSPKLYLSQGLNYLTTSSKYTCEACGYSGSVFMELEKE